MSQQELEAAVAKTTGESLATIHSLGFGIADPLEVNYDPERPPLTFDWDTMGPEEWPAA